MIKEKFLLYGIKSIFISGLVNTTKKVRLLPVLEETYKRFEVFCYDSGVILIDTNIKYQGSVVYILAKRILES